MAADSTMIRTAVPGVRAVARAVCARSASASVARAISQCVPAAPAHATTMRRAFSSHSSSASTYSASATPHSNGNTAASAAAQEARIAQLRAELDAVKKKKSGALLTNTVGAVAIGELMAAFCVVSMTGAWAWYCVDWTKLSEKKDRTIAEVTQRWKQREQTANAAAIAPPSTANDACQPLPPAQPAAR